MKLAFFLLASFCATLSYSYSATSTRQEAIARMIPVAAAVVREVDVSSLISAMSELSASSFSEDVRINIQKWAESPNFLSELAVDIESTSHKFLDHKNTEGTCAYTQDTRINPVVTWFLPSCIEETKDRLSTVLFLIGESVHHFGFRADSNINFVKHSFRKLIGSEEAELSKKYDLSSPLLELPELTRGRSFEEPMKKLLGYALSPKNLYVNAKGERVSHVSGKNLHVYLGISTQGRMRFSGAFDAGYKEQANGSFRLNHSDARLIKPVPLKIAFSNEPDLIRNYLCSEPVVFKNNWSRAEGKCRAFMDPKNNHANLGSSNTMIMPCYHDFIVTFDYIFNDDNSTLIGISYSIKKPVSLSGGGWAGGGHVGACGASKELVVEAEFGLLNINLSSLGGE